VSIFHRSKDGDAFHNCNNLPTDTILRCHSWMSSFTRFTISLIPRWQNRSPRKCRKTLSSYLMRLTTLVYLFLHVSTHKENFLCVDNVCIESLSIDLTRPMLDSAARSVGRLGEKIDEQVFRCLEINGRCQ